MPRLPKETQVAAAVRGVLRELEGGLTPITHESVQRLLKERGEGVARKTYFKYVAEGTALSADVRTAQERQRKHAALSAAPPAIQREARIRELNDAVAHLTAANRSLLLERASFVEKLHELGVSQQVIQAAGSHVLNAIPATRGFKKRPATGAPPGGWRVR